MGDLKNERSVIKEPSGASCDDRSYIYDDECLEKTAKLTLLAEAAHSELLKQKMKAAFEAKIGKKMDKVADLAVDAALTLMKGRMAQKKAHEDFEEKLMTIFKGN